MIFSHTLKRDLVVFQQSLTQLRQNLQEISPLWQDEKFAELQESVTALATNAHAVLRYGELCTDELAHFQAISAESF